MTGYCDRDAAGKLTGKEFWGWWLSHVTALPSWNDEYIDWAHTWLQGCKNKIGTMYSTEIQSELGTQGSGILWMRSTIPPTSSQNALARHLDFWLSLLSLGEVVRWWIHWSRLKWLGDWKRVVSTRFQSPNQVPCPAPIRHISKPLPVTEPCRQRPRRAFQTGCTSLRLSSSLKTTINPSPGWAFCSFRTSVPLEFSGEIKMLWRNTCIF